MVGGRGAKALRALDPATKGLYERFGLNEQQIATLATATPKRDYDGPRSDPQVGVAQKENGVGRFVGLSPSESDESLLSI